MVIVPLAPTVDCVSSGVIVTVSAAVNAPLGEMGIDRGKLKVMPPVFWTPSATRAALAKQEPPEVCPPRISFPLPLTKSWMKATPLVEPDSE